MKGRGTQEAGESCGDSKAVGLYGLVLTDGCLTPWPVHPPPLATLSLSSLCRHRNSRACALLLTFRAVPDTRHAACHLLLVAATGSTFCLESERRSIEAEWPMEQREAGRLGEWRAGGGHLDLAALGAACGCCGSAPSWCAFAGSIIQGRLFAWLLHVPCQSWWCVYVYDTAWGCDVLGCIRVLMCD